MSYHVWSVYGYGICVNDIETTPEKLLKLASLNPELLEIVRNHLDDVFEKSYKDEELVMEDFEELEGTYGEHDVAFVLYNLLKDELRIEYATNFNGWQYILYTPTFPWCLKENEHTHSQEEVKSIFEKYLKILTDEDVSIDYYNVEDGG